MDIDEEDDFYAPEESAPSTSGQFKSEATAHPVATKQEKDDEDLEEGEEEDEGDSDDSDIDIIIERKDGAKAPPPAQKYNEIRNIPQRKGSSDIATILPSVKKETPTKDTKKSSGADLPGLSVSKIDVNAKPIYEPAGKPITQVNIDEDLNENDKPWRRPGTDITDYFNYGFDEFTWALYASKQDSLRSEYSQEKVALNNKKMMEDLNMMMMGGMPGMMPGAAGGAMMPGAEGMPPEMQQMMQQMMASGMDPTQMDPAAMFAAMQGNQGAAAGGASAAGGFGQGQNQGYGFDQNMNSGGDARNNRGGFGRGRGRRGGW